MSVVTAVKRFNPNYCLTLNLSFIWQRRRVRVVDLIARLRQQTEVSFIKPSAGVKRCCLLCGWCNPCHLFVSLPGSVDEHNSGGAPLRLLLCWVISFWWPTDWWLLMPCSVRFSSVSSYFEIFCSSCLCSGLCPALLSSNDLFSLWCST